MILGAITPVGNIAPRSNSGSISFTCSASSIIHAGGVPARRSSDQNRQRRKRSEVGSQRSEKKRSDFPPSDL